MSDLNKIIKDVEFNLHDFGIIQQDKINLLIKETKQLEANLIVAIDIAAAFYCQTEYKNKLQEKTAELMYKKLRALEGKE